MKKGCFISVRWLANLKSCSKCCYYCYLQLTAALSNLMWQQLHTAASISPNIPNASLINSSHRVDPDHLSFDPGPAQFDENRPGPALDFCSISHGYIVFRTKGDVRWNSYPSEFRTNWSEVYRMEILKIWLKCSSLVRYSSYTHNRIN